MPENRNSVWDEIRSLIGALIIALILVYSNSTFGLSWYQIVILAFAVSVLFHEIIPKSVARIREANDA